ncbi:SIS domain-containing protein [Aneurinibacillus terranovensis]|uniref:SIS domain-containing protein n=1 Tax=Aneurinibacillus terranovensis TaxID=278991 RepID=UPI000403800A|nr:SIS domain-containing protein [Aneurinibacillus terranovensis]
MFLHVSEEKNKELGVYHTQKEIVQQPRLWKETYEYIVQEKKRIQLFFQSVMEKHKTIKVILTGAGTSAFVGECLSPYLHKVCDAKIFTIENIPTTSIVSNPEYYLDADTPTIMVSFARSGNSPESAASVELGEQLVKDFYQINITCNKEGQLAKKSGNNAAALLLLLPEDSNDQGFAMTSSFTCMMLCAMLVFQIKDIESLKNNIDVISAIGERILTSEADNLEALAKLPFTNIVYLGSGPLSGLSHEASLKMLELVGGLVFTAYDSPLGFRHGPKSMINDQTLVMIMISSNPYTQKYDLDMLKELYREKETVQLKLAAISGAFVNEAKDNCDYYFYSETEEIVSNGTSLEDSWLAFPFILYAQMLAVFKSLHLGFRPDNPCPGGSLNRVVQGVTIYPFQ